MTTPTDLIERLEGASVGSRELDGRIWMALFDPEPGNYFVSLEMEMWPSGVPGEVLSTSSGQALADTLKPIPVGKFTTSLDAALALAERVVGASEAVFVIWQACVDAKKPNEIPRLACIAILKALRASEQSK